MLRVGIQAETIEQTRERADEIAFVREHCVRGAILGRVRQHTELERGGSDIDSERLVRHGFGRAGGALGQGLVQRFALGQGPGTCIEPTRPIGRSVLDPVAFPD